MDGVLEEIRQRLIDARVRSEKKQIGGGPYGKVPQSTLSTWESHPPKQLLVLRKLVQRYSTNADYILALSKNWQPRDDADLSPDERSILEIMREVPEQRREEIIRLAEVVREMHRKEEEDGDTPSLFDRAKGKYESGEYPPRIIGEDDKESPIDNNADDTSGDLEDGEDKESDNSEDDE